MWRLEVTGLWPGLGVFPFVAPPLGLFVSIRLSLRLGTVLVVQSPAASSHLSPFAFQLEVLLLGSLAA